jgi:antitoxin component of MazEF toxin-antitoxin module
VIKKLTTSGNSLALVLDRPLLEAAGVDASTPLEISTSGDVILISPVRSAERNAKLRAGVEAMHRRYAGVFARLAE